MEESLCPSPHQGMGTRCTPHSCFEDNSPPLKHTRGLKKKKSTSNNYARALVFAKKESIPPPPHLHTYFEESLHPSSRQEMGTKCTPHSCFKDNSSPLKHTRGLGVLQTKTKKNRVPAKDFFYDDTLGQLVQHGKKIEIDLEIDEMNKLLLNNDAYVK